MNIISSLTIDSTYALTDLCRLGAHFPTDKSSCVKLDNGTVRINDDRLIPNGISRHCYTAIYDFLFSSKRYSDIVFGEAGLDHNYSMNMWRAYFPRATLFGFDHSERVIENAKSHNLYNTHYGTIRMGDPASISEALNKCGTMFDIFIDDTSHIFEHQCLFVAIAYKYMKTGGTIIIEDIHRPWSEAHYTNALQPYFKYFSSGMFVDSKHENLDHDSPDAAPPWFDNSKLLVLVRNETPPDMHLPVIPEPEMIAEAIERIRKQQELGAPPIHGG
jgi:hypothetical protein